METDLDDLSDVPAAEAMETDLDYLSDVLLLKAGGPEAAMDGLYMVTP